MRGKPSVKREKVTSQAVTNGRPRMRIGLLLVLAALAILYIAMLTREGLVYRTEGELLFRINSYHFAINPLQAFHLGIGALLLAGWLALSPRPVAREVRADGKPGRLGWGRVALAFGVPLLTGTLVLQRFILDFIPHWTLLFLLAGLAGIIGWWVLRWPQRAKAHASQGYGVLLTAVSVGVIVALLSVMWIHQGFPLISDAQSQIAQARLLASGRFTLPLSPGLSQVLVFPNPVPGPPMFSQYPPGYILALLPVVLLQLPLHAFDVALAGVLLALTCWLAGELATPGQARLARLLALLLGGGAPMFLIMSGSMMNHQWTAVLLAGALGCWWKGSRGLPADAGQLSARMALLFAAGGFALGWATITRPLTGAAHGLVWCIAALIWWSRDAERLRGPRLRAVIAAACGGLPPLLLFFFYNYKTTGHPLVMGYQLSNPELHRLGFHAHGWEGHPFTPRVAVDYQVTNFITGNLQLFGWTIGSWWPLLGLLLRPAAAAAFRSRSILLLLAGLCVAQVGVYFFYQFHGLTLGPRFWFEAWPLAVVLAAIALTEPARRGGVLGERLMVVMLLLFAVGGLMTGTRFWSDRFAVIAAPHVALARFLEAHRSPEPKVIVIDNVGAEATGIYLFDPRREPLIFVATDRLEIARTLPELQGLPWLDARFGATTSASRAAGP